MRRREFIALFGGTVVTWPLCAHGQAKSRSVLVSCPSGLPKISMTNHSLRRLDKAYIRRVWSRIGISCSMLFGPEAIPTRAVDRGAEARSPNADPLWLTSASVSCKTPDLNYSNYVSQCWRPHRDGIGRKSFASGP